MTYKFHPAAEAEFLESVGYYESKVKGFGGVLIQEFETLAERVLVAFDPTQKLFANFPQVCVFKARSVFKSVAEGAVKAYVGGPYESYGHTVLAVEDSPT